MVLFRLLFCSILLVSSYQPNHFPFPHSKLKGRCHGSRQVLKCVGQRPSTEPVSVPRSTVLIPGPQAVGRLLWRHVLSRMVISLCVISIAILLPFDRDPEAKIAKILPTTLAHALRDCSYTWDTFNMWTWVLNVPALAFTRPDLLREVLLPAAHNIKNIPYSDHSPMAVLDIFHHGCMNGELKDVVVFVHGGVWSQGSKDIFGVVGKRLRDAGFVSVVVGYRRYPTGDAKEQAQDVGKALCWVSRHISQYGGDPSSVILLGHSSGAHISALCLLSSSSDADVEPASHRQVSRTSGGPSKKLVRCFVGLSGVYDITTHYEYEKKRGVHEISAMKPANGGDPSISFEDVSPTVLALRYVDQNPISSSLKNSLCLLPTAAVLYHSADDTTVPASSTIEFYHAVSKLSDRFGEDDDPVMKGLLDIKSEADGIQHNHSGGHAGVLLDLIQRSPQPRVLGLIQQALELSRM